MKTSALLLALAAASVLALPIDEGEIWSGKIRIKERNFHTDSQHGHSDDRSLDESVTPDQHGSLDDRSLDWSVEPEPDASLIEYTVDTPTSSDGNDWIRRSPGGPIAGGDSGPPEPNSASVPRTESKNTRGAEPVEWHNFHKDQHGSLDDRSLDWSVKLEDAVDGSPGERVKRSKLQILDDDGVDSAPMKRGDEKRGGTVWEREAAPPLGTGSPDWPEWGKRTVHPARGNDWLNSAVEASPDGTAWDNRKARGLDGGNSRDISADSNGWGKRGGIPSSHSVSDVTSRFKKRMERANGIVGTEGDTGKGKGKRRNKPIVGKAAEPGVEIEKRNEGVEEEGDYMTFPMTAK